MYLKGSNWSMLKRKKRSNPFAVILLIIAIIGVFLFDRLVRPYLPPILIGYMTPTPTRLPESYAADAEALMNDGKYKQAIESFRQAVASDPQNPSYYLTIAKLEIFSGLYKDAVTDAANALLLNSNSAQAFALQGWAYGFLADYLQAENALKQAIKLDATIPQSYAYKAMVLAFKTVDGLGELGTMQDAIDASRTAISMAPDALETHWARGFVLYVTSDYDLAVTELLAASTLNSNIAEIHMELGYCYRALQQYVQAIEEFNRANALNPTDPLPDTYIAAVYATNGEYAKAIQYAQAAVDNAPDSPYMWGNLGRMYYRNLQYEDAVLALGFTVHGGTTRDGVVIKGLPLDYTGRIPEYYYTYGLALAKLGYCNDALPVSQALQQTVKNDELSVANAQEIISICQEFITSGAPTPTPLTTPTNTPASAEAITQTPTKTP
jgi:tetratricopeptide (TPR) repeat protein